MEGVARLILRMGIREFQNEPKNVIGEAPEVAQ
jgi:hypothetical protein